MGGRLGRTFPLQAPDVPGQPLRSSPQRAHVEQADAIIPQRARPGGLLGGGRLCRPRRPHRPYRRLPVALAQLFHHSLLVQQPAQLLADLRQEHERGKARGVGWERVLAIHDTTPKATRFLSRWCGTSGADGGREREREREPERERLGPGGCGASEAFKAEAREI